AFAFALLGAALAQAQEPSTQELLQQIKLLQKRIEQLEANERQRQAADQRAAAASRQPATAQPRQAGTEPAAPAATGAAAPTRVVVPAGSAPMPEAGAVPPPPPGDPNKPWDGSLMMGSVKLTLGGYIDLTGYFRSRNENRGTGTGYNAIPFA